MRYLVIIFSLMLCSMFTHAQVYKWVDENGKTQYSDQPPLSSNVQKEQRLKIHSVPTPVSSLDADDENGANTRTLADERLDFDKRRQERLEKEAEKKANAAQNKQKCVDAQSKLRVFLESPRLRMPDGQGGLVYIDDDVRQQKINEVNKEIATYCK